MMDQLYPLRFREILRDYDFGGRRIADVFDKEGLPRDHKLSETWEVCDRPRESSVVKNGALAGSTLHDLIGAYGEELLGSAVTARSGSRFPLLIKRLDAANPLGEQVHPDDALARERGSEDTGKTEAWYMLRARPGATIHCGIRQGIGRAEVLQALVDGRVGEAMEEQPAGPGDAFLLHAGTMHCSRGGILFYEIMQNSDITIGLRSRELARGTEERRRWAEQTMTAVRLVQGRDCRILAATIASGTNRISFIFACSYFALERLDLSTPLTMACTGERLFVLTQIEGRCTISCGNSLENLGPGQSCLLPASLGSVSIVPNGRCSLLKAYVPDLILDVIAPLRRAGIKDSDIIALGGEAARNPLIELMGD
jgi:mannose-6-phosphate isomerase